MPLYKIILSTWVSEVCVKHENVLNYLRYHSELSKLSFQGQIPLTLYKCHFGALKASVC